ncbi:MAG: nuclear transport factor 2 family protein [Pseudomonadota bacterium]
MRSEHAIQDLLFSYARSIDAGDFEALASLFTHGAIEGPDGSLIQGKAAVLALYQKTTRIYTDTGTPCTHHVTTNVDIKVEGEQASALSYFTVYQSLSDFPLQAIICGRYHDDFAQADGRWLFRKRRIVPTLLGDLSRHLLITL